MTDRELMQQALDALEDVGGEWGFTSQRTLPKRMNAIEALRARLAQPEQEQTRSQKMRDAGITRRPKRWDKDGDDTEQEPVAIDSGKIAPPKNWGELSREEIIKRELDIAKRIADAELYTAPPQREWQGLTESEIESLRHLIDWTAHWSYGNFARAIEAKLREKNA